MITIGICCGLKSSSSGFFLKDFLQKKGFEVYLLAEYSEEDFKKKIRTTTIVISLLEFDYWESSRGCFEMNEIHESHSETGNPFKIIPIRLEDAVFFPPSKNFDKYISKKNPRESVINECIQQDVCTKTMTMEQKMNLLTDYPMFLTLCRISVPLVEGFRFQNTYHLIAFELIDNIARELNQVDLEYSHLPLTTGSRKSEKGTLKLGTRLLNLNQSVRVTVSIWNMNKELFEYGNGFLEAVEADSEEEFIAISNSPVHDLLNRSLKQAFQRRILMLHHEPITQETELHKVFTCKVHLEPKRMNFTLKAIYDANNQISGFICFSTVFERDFPQNPPKNPFETPQLLDAIQMDNLTRLSKGKVRVTEDFQPNHVILSHSDPPESSPCFLHDDMDLSYLDLSNGGPVMTSPIISPEVSPDTFVFETEQPQHSDYNLNENLQFSEFQFVQPVTPDFFHNTSHTSSEPYFPMEEHSDQTFNQFSSTISYSKMKSKRNVFLKTPDDFLHPEDTNSNYNKKPFETIRSTNLMFKSYSGPAPHKKRRTAQGKKV